MDSIHYLIAQSKKPEGFIGSLLIRIMNRAHAGITAWALKKIEIKKDAVILDIGCGGGRTLKVLSGNNPSGKLYGIDYSQNAVESSIRANIADVKAGKLKVTQAGVTSIPFPDGSFNLITAFQTHYFWPDLQNDIREVFRVLKERGFFLLTAETYKIDYHMQHYKTQAELEHLLISTGFTGVRFYQDKGWVCVVGAK